MSDLDPSQTLRPTHCEVSVSPDRRQLALTFKGNGQATVKIVLPLLGAAGLQAKLARCLYLLGVRKVRPAADRAAAAAPAEAPSQAA